LPNSVRACRAANANQLSDQSAVLIDLRRIDDHDRICTDAKLPAIFSHPDPVEAGGLMAYSFDLIELYKRAGNNIDAILRGAKPGDIPIYQVTKFELSINLKTAKQLGLSVPPALVVSADKVIE